jgi:hypothetical protein
MAWQARAPGAIDAKQAPANETISVHSAELSRMLSSAPPTLIQLCGMKSLALANQAHDQLTVKL